jgi:SAM-dependent methyltransferase
MQYGRSWVWNSVSNNRGMSNQIRNWWRKFGKKQQPAWPRMEQSKYRSYQAQHPFDAEHGVETGGLMYELHSGHQHDMYNNGYFAVAPSVFHAVMQTLHERLHVDFSRFSFVDLGSGKGRALLLAASYPFREIIGVEISPELDSVARANIARFAASHSQHHIVSIQGDAADFRWPTTPLLVYIWNSFTEPVMEQVFRNLESSLTEVPRQLYVVYIHPELESLLSGLPWLARLWQEEVPMSEQDYAAWAFPNRSEMYALYCALL